MGDLQSVVELYVEDNDWEEAFAWVEKHPQFKELVYVPYATSLAEKDEFLAAQKAFYKAGKPDQAFRVLQELTHNAVTESRYGDAGYYFWMLSLQCLEQSRDEEGSQTDSRILAVSGPSSSQVNGNSQFSQTGTATQTTQTLSSSPLNRVSVGQSTSQTNAVQVTQGSGTTQKTTANQGTDKATNFPTVPNTSPTVALTGTAPM